MKRRDEIVVGVFTIVAVGLLIASMFWFARGGLSKGYPIYSTFAWGEGLKQGQPVLFSGANIGYVDEIILLDSGLVIEMRIAKKQRIPEGTVASIAPYGFFGDKLIALKPTHGPNGRFVEAGDTIPSGAGGVQLDAIINRVDTISRSLNELVTSLKGELVDQGAIRSIRTTARSADSMIKLISRLAQTQSAELTKTQETLRNLATSVDSARLRPMIEGLRAATANADSLIIDFKGTNQRLKTLLAKVDSGPGLAARLLNDRAFADSVTATMAEFKALMADFKANPRKYIRLSIF
jgi:phospholipid/cholesterol/gamma-HCH transport system substrate-binding protein